MANTQRPLFFQSQLTAVTATLYTAPLAVTFIFKLIRVCNTSNAAVPVRLYFVPVNGAAAQSNAALYDFSVPANDFIEFGEGQVLLPGGLIQASAGTPAVVNVQVSGVEM